MDILKEIIKDIKKSRLMSFLLVAAIYALAAAVGVMIYELLTLPYWLGLLIADAVATVVVFAFSVLLKNASVYDPYWSVQPMVILLIAVSGRSITAAGSLVLIAVLFWGIRLTANWAYTFKGLEYQDWRYTMLKEKTGTLYPFVNFTGIHMVPTLIVWACVLPALAIIESGVKANAGSYIFFLLSVGAAVMQGIADIQMHRYRRNRKTPFIRTGLWKYSRHPNYLGEILMWWGIALSCLCVLPGKWYLLVGAAANTALFLLVSIPMADGRQSAKPGFDTYKAETRKLLPVKK